MLQNGSIATGPEAIQSPGTVRPSSLEIVSLEWGNPIEGPINSPSRFGEFARSRAAVGVVGALALVGAVTVGSHMSEARPSSAVPEMQLNESSAKPVVFSAPEVKAQVALPNSAYTNEITGDRSVDQIGLFNIDQSKPEASKDNFYSELRHNPDALAFWNACLDTKTPGYDVCVANPSVLQKADDMAVQYRDMDLAKKGVIAESVVSQFKNAKFDGITVENGTYKTVGIDKSGKYYATTATRQNDARLNYTFTIDGKAYKVQIRACDQLTVNEVLTPPAPANTTTTAVAPTTTVTEAPTTTIAPTTTVKPTTTTVKPTTTTVKPTTTTTRPTTTTTIAPTTTTTRPTTTTTIAPTTTTTRPTTTTTIAPTTTTTRPPETTTTTIAPTTTTTRPPTTTTTAPNKDPGQDQNNNQGSPNVKPGSGGTPGPVGATSTTSTTLRPVEPGGTTTTTIRLGGSTTTIPPVPFEG